MTALLDLAALRALLEQGTPGPWQDDGRTIMQAEAPYADVIPTEVRCGMYCQGGQADPPSAADSALIVAAVNALPALLQVVSAACAFDDAWFVASVKDCGTDTPVERGAWALANAQARALADAVKEYRVTIDRARGEGR